MIEKIPEIEATRILSNYEGYNNQIIDLKNKMINSKYFKLTRTQADYILKYHNTVPKVAKKYVTITKSYGEKLMTEKKLISEPDKIWCEKLLCESDLAYHFYGKITENEKMYCFWVPKYSIIQEEKKLNREIDYSPYSKREPLPHQKVAIEKLLANDKYILADDMGLGKFLPVDTPIFTPHGKKRIGDLVIGETVIGSSGYPTKVSGIFPQGVKETYKISFSDGYSILAGDEHLWAVYPSSHNLKNVEKKIAIVSTKQMYEGDTIQVKGYGNKNNHNYNIKTHYKLKSNKYKWQIPLVKPIQFKRKDPLPLDPYFLGVCLAAGIFRRKGARFNCEPQDFDEMLAKYGVNSSGMVKGKKVGLINLKGRDVLLGLNDSKIKNRFIPTSYRYSSVENRLALIQGILDAKGFKLKSKTGVKFSTVSERFADEICEMVQTLGGIAKKYCGYYFNRGNKVSTFKVTIILPPTMDPFRLKRKMDGYNKPTKKDLSRQIVKIEKVGEYDSVCISVNAPDKLYVVDHCIVTHNTTSSIIAALESGAKKILIICPATLKINWKREIENYSNRNTLIVEGRKWGSTFDFYIINYDIVKNYHTIGEPELGMEKNRQIVNEKFDLAIVDEAHYISNTTAQRTKLINDILKDIPKVWLLTGTPMTSRPINYYNLLKIVNSNVSLNWQSYVKRYCGGYQFTVNKKKIWKTDGATNLDELRVRTKNIVLRRMKTDILDLPDKIITPVFLELNSRVYNEELDEFIKISKENRQKESLSITINRLMKVRQIISLEKIDYTCDIIDRCLEQDKKVIVFTNFTETLDILHEKYSKNSVILDGRMSKEKRQISVDKFQNEKKTKIFISNIIAGGVGITLTEAEVVIMNDLSFVPAHHNQAEDRAFRYGQKKNVSVYYPIFENTIEMIIYNMIKKKQNIIDQVMGDGDYSESFATTILKEIL